MEAYTDFASVYDIFMDNVPYEQWCERICSLLTKYDERVIPEDDEALASEANLCVDLGCGTGTLTRMLAKRGLDMIGIDSSYEMLEVARSGDTYESEILYLNQDMREFELYSTVGSVVCVCDCINYLLEKEDVLSTFRLVNNYLYPRGLFIFDFNTVHKYRDVIGDTTIAENREEGSFIWENYYDEEKNINEYDLTMYIRSDLLASEYEMISETEAVIDIDEEDSLEEEPLYIRSQETHIQRGYEVDEILELVKTAGLELIEVFDSDTEATVDENTERVCVVARESGKKNL